MLELITATVAGKMAATFCISMLPVLELRAGIPFGAAMGLSPVQVLVAAVLGNLLPMPFILIFLQKIFVVLRRWDKTAGIVDWLERKAHSKSESVQKYQAIGLCILVAIPLPGTGGWTGALVASVLGLPFKKALPPIIAGVAIAATIVMCLTYGFIALV